MEWKKTDVLVTTPTLLVKSPPIPQITPPISMTNTTLVSPQVIVTTSTGGADEVDESKTSKDKEETQDRASEEKGTEVYKFTSDRGWHRVRVAPVNSSPTWSRYLYYCIIR